MQPSRLRDARAARSSRSLVAALLALLERKAFEQITVREITLEAGISYATFFRHHPTKEALLDHVAAEQIRHLVGLSLTILDERDSAASVLALCQYVADHRLLWTALLTGGAAGAMRAELLRLSRTVAAERAPAEHWMPVDLAVNISVSVIFETLAWWLAQPGDVPVVKVAQTLERLLLALSLDERRGPGGR